MLQDRCDACGTVQMWSKYMSGVLEYCHDQDDKCSLLKATYLAAHTVKYHGLTFVSDVRCVTIQVQKRKVQKPQHLGFPRGPPPWY